jgi:hypothetical protein
VLAQPLDHCQRFGMDEEQFLDGWLDEAVLDAMLDHGDERVVIAMAVHHADGFGVFLQLPADQDFEELFVGADPAGKDEKGVAPFFEQGLALSHGVGDDQFVTFTIGDLLLHQELGDDADDGSIGLTCRPRDFAHQSNAPAAIDKREATPGDFAAHLHRANVEIRIKCGGTRAIHGDGRHDDNGNASRPLNRESRPRAHEAVRAAVRAVQPAFHQA